MGCLRAEAVGRAGSGRVASRGSACGQQSFGTYQDSPPCSCHLSLFWTGYPIPKPDLIFHLEQGEEPWVPDSPHPEEGDIVTGVYTGE